MPAAKHNIIIEQGAKFSMPLEVQNSDGSAFDLSNYSGRGKIRSDYSSASALATFTITGTFDTTGIFTVELGATVTDDLEEGSAVYDVEIADVSDADNVIRLLQGNVLITPEATK